MTPPTSTPPATPVAWDVFDEEDRYLGQVEAQFWTDARDLAAAKYGIERDALLVVLEGAFFGRGNQ